jgi:multidrug transporter EmrE-like cation transporter
MKTHPMAIVAVALATFLTATGQLFYKLGANNLIIGPELFTNWPLLAGLCIYAVSAGILIIALKFGELSVLYPVVALSFVWVNILSAHFLGEPLNIFKWVGVVFIIGGVSSIGLGSKGQKEVAA